MPDIIDTGTANTVVVTDRRTVVTLEREETIVEVSSPGPQGRRGETGATGGTLAPINFSYGDATPKLLYTPTDNVVIDLAQIVLRTVFDGVGASLSVGTMADHESVISLNSNDPYEAATYETSPEKQLSSGESLYLFITSGTGATQGSGQIVLSPLSI